MLLPELRREVARYAQKMYDSQLVQATQGNLSARDLESGLICVTPSGTDYQLLMAEDIVVIDENGKVVEGKRRPTVETPVHTLILRRRHDIHCVMHTHSPYATAFGVIYQSIPMILSDSALYLGCEVPITPYHMSGTPEFAELVVDTLKDGPAAIWGNHGVVVVGADLSLTFSIAHALEDSAKVYTIAKQLGTPVFLPQEEVIKLRDFWNNNTGRSLQSCNHRKS
jgi:L-ribulose-5-phosphate 4-epimerase